MSIKIGGDPEFFVIDPKGEPIGAFEFFPGTKEDPYPLKDGSVQVDGFAVEIGIDPCDTAKEFNSRVVSLVSQCRDFIPSGYDFSFKAVEKFSNGYFNSVSPVFKAVGCSPSWDFLSGEQEVPPDLIDSRKRYAGGHIHIGWTNGLDMDCPITKSTLTQCAKHIQKRLTLSNLDNGGENEYKSRANTRLRDYRCYNSFRPKSYGLELRRPSNWWVDPKLCDKRERLFQLVHSSARDYR